MASATVPPIMPILRIGGRIALDGGFVDNVPVEPLAAVERAGGRTLVLLTRRYDALPEVPGRIYVQPSEPIAGQAVRHHRPRRHQQQPSTSA